VVLGANAGGWHRIVEGGSPDVRVLDQIRAKRREKLRRNLAASMFFVAF
jgi:hypothetical protein